MNNPFLVMWRARDQLGYSYLPFKWFGVSPWTLLQHSEGPKFPSPFDCNVFSWDTECLVLKKFQHKIMASIWTCLLAISLPLNSKLIFYHACKANLHLVKGKFFIIWIIKFLEVKKNPQSCIIQFLMGFKTGYTISHTKISGIWIKL